jgi:hypothetical protein
MLTLEQKKEITSKLSPEQRVELAALLWETHNSYGKDFDRNYNRDEQWFCQRLLEQQ